MDVSPLDIEVDGILMYFFMCSNWFPPLGYFEIGLGGCGTLDCAKTPSMRLDHRSEGDTDHLQWIRGSVDPRSYSAWKQGTSPDPVDSVDPGQDGLGAWHPVGLFRWTARSRSQLGPQGKPC